MDSNGQHFELLNNLHTGVVVHRPDSSITYCNKRATELLQLTEDQMLGKTALDPTWHFVDERGNAMPPSGYPVMIVIESRAPIEEMVLGVRIAGQDTPNWLLVSAFPDFAPDGNVKQVVVNFYSIQQRKLLENELAVSTAQIDDLYNHAPCGYFSLDADGKFLHINDTTLRWLATTRADVIGIKSPLDFLQDEQKEGFKARFSIFRTTGRIDDVEIDIIALNGTRRRVSLTATAVYGSGGNFLMSRSVIYDITTLHKTKRALESMHSEQHAMLDNDMVGIVKLQDRIATWKNRAIDRIFGYEANELLGKSSRVLYQDDEQFESLGREAYPVLSSGGHYRTQMEMRRKDSSPVWIDVSGVLLSVGDKTSMWFMTDISELKAYQRKVENLAFHDSLTGLPNRLLFVDRARQAFAVAARSETFCAICFLDLDGFKPVNDVYGHAAGDLVLKEVSDRLQKSTRPNDTVCRLGGDEFILLLTQLESFDDYRPVLERALFELSKPIEIGIGLNINVSASAGVSRYPKDALEIDELMKISDAAMYKSKTDGSRRFVVHNDERSDAHPN
uniref:Diguanylate cyclase n=1 Tax=Curvibacter symbiont subsp. Hydra magnipapillata TaxID=667019 RepID=C9YAJ8_CURXX|nr:hypothetical protein Csp_A11490 [Curvibacter putative symbiont of Hydra magnipapillata]